MRTKIDNTRLLANTGLRVVHIRPHEVYGGNHGVTVAYKPPQAPGHSIEIATAICNPGDVFTKKIGTKLAVENFLAGKTVLVPDQLALGATQALKAIFA